jgi:hypothetical protein
MVCGKEIYSTRKLAIAAMNGHNNDRRSTSSKIKLKYSYFCGDCNGWHLSSGIRHKRKIRYIQDNSNINHSEKKKAKQSKASGTKNFIVHDRLKFKIK